MRLHNLSEALLYDGTWFACTWGHGSAVWTNAKLATAVADRLGASIQEVTHERKMTCTS